MRAWVGVMGAMLVLLGCGKEASPTPSLLAPGADATGEIDDAAAESDLEAAEDAATDDDAQAGPDTSAEADAPVTADAGNDAGNAVAGDAGPDVGVTDAGVVVVGGVQRQPAPGGVATVCAGQVCVRGGIQ